MTSDLNNDLDDLACLWDRAWKYSYQGENLLALETIERLVRLNQSNVHFLLARCHFLRLLFQFERAEEELRELIRKDENNPLGWTELGLVHLNRHESQSAAYCFNRSAELLPDFNTFTLLASAEIDFDPVAAAKHANMALQLKPDWDEALQILNAATKATSNGK